jgi:hypothetical protein
MAVMDNSKALSQAGQIISMEAVSELKRFLSEPSLETMTVAPQFGLSQIAHNSISCTNYPPCLCGDWEGESTGHSYCKNYSTLIRRCFVAAVLNLLRNSNNSLGERPDADKNSVKAVRLKTATITARKFGGREGARTPDLLVANEKFAVQDVRNVQCVQQNAFGGRKLLKAFSLLGWTLTWTPYPILRIRKYRPRDRLTFIFPELFRLVRYRLHCSFSGVLP